ncbi:MAG: hypothetical protein GY754_06425 [bacterium]|nr:hypothetical protein [bacterium]
MNRNKNFNIISLIVAVMILIPVAGYTEKISERRLKEYGSAFLAQVVRENSSYKKQVRITLQGIIQDENAGIRLIDKFALFIHDSQKQGIAIKKTKYFYRDGLFTFFIILQDENDGQLYTLYLEYEYIKKRRICNLKDIYFSLVFDEKIKEMEKFFKYR